MAENIQKVILTADNMTKAAFGAFRKDVTDADKSVLALEKSSALLKTGLGALGISLSGAAFAGMIKGVADAQDKLAKLSASTGIAVDTLAGLQFAAEQSGTSVERVGKAVTNFSRIVLESNGETDKYSRLIKALGIDLEALKSATPEQQFISLAGAIKDNVAEQDRAAVVTALLGSRYTELIPLLSQGEQGISDMIARGKELNPVTKESAAAAELFNDKVDELTRQFNTFKVEAGNKVIPVLAEITAGMAEAARQGGVFAGVLAGIKQTADKTFTSDAFLKIVEFSGPLGTILADRVRAKKALQDIETQAKQTADALDDVKMPDIKTPPRSFVNILKDIDNESKKASASTKTVTKSLSEEEKQAQETARKIEQLTLKFDPLIAYNKELNELISLRASGLPDSVYSAAVAESIDKYTKATGGVADGISEIDEKTRQLEITTRQVFDTNEQIAINGIRGIQTALADGLFNFVRNGMDDFVRAIKDGLARAAAEFAAARILKNTGIASLFGLGSGTALASGGGVADAGVSALNIASLGSSALNLAKGGFGLPGFVGGGIQSLGGFVGSNSLFQFGAGVGGDLLGAGIGTAGSLGAGLGALAGPAAIAGIADIGLRQLFGDKKLGGTAGDILSYVPVVGTLINGLFGRGAPKFQNEALVGNVSTSGFDGVLNQAFREKGGVFRSNRTSNFIADTDTGNLLNQFGRLSESGNIPGALRDSATDPAVKRALEVGKFLDEAFGSIGETLQNTADKLGLSSDALNNFSAELDLVSEKGETLSEAQISEEITRISDAMIDTLIPNLDELAKKGETSADTLTRLNNQFGVLQYAAELFGNTSEQAEEKVRSLGLEGQSALIDLLGGADAAFAQFSDFYNTVFTDAQKIDYVEAQILKVLKPLEIDFIPTMEQLYEAVASGNPKLAKAALDIDGLVSEFDRLTESVNGVTDPIKEIADSLDGLSEALAKERNAFTAARREMQEGRSTGPTIAANLGGKIFTEAEIRAMQQAEVGSAADSATALIKEQISRAGNDQQLLRDLNATLEFIKFQSGQSNISETASRLSDEELARQAAAQLKALNEAERVQRNTSFNGAVQFAFPKGTNQSADAADRARLSQLDVFKSMMADPAMSVSSAFSDLTEAARNLADELLLGDKSILNVFQKTSEAQRQYNEIIDRARSGNATSSELSSGVNNLLDAQLNSASNKFEFDKQFATVVNDLQSIGQTAEDKRAEEQKKSMAELRAEIKQLRQELNAANVAIAKSTAKTADVLDRWSVVGLPATEA